MAYLVKCYDVRTLLKQKFSVTVFWQWLMMCLMLSLSSGCPLFGQSTAEENLKIGASLETASPGEAIYYLTRAITIDPTLISAYRHRAKALELASNIDGAYADLLRVIGLDKKFAPDYINLADLQRKKGELDAAVLSLTRAIELDPKGAHTYYERGRIKEQQKDIEGSAADYTSAIEADPNKINSNAYHHSRGDLRKRAGDLEGAIADYGKAIRATGRNTFYNMEPSFGRGSAFYMKHAWKEALGDFHHAADNCRNHMSYWPKIHFWLVRTRMGEQKDASKELAEFMKAASTSKYMGEFGGKFISFILEQTTQAELFAYTATQGDKTNQADLDSVIWYYCGIKRLMADDKTGAIDCFKKSVAIELKDPPEEYYWANCELKIISP